MPDGIRTCRRTLDRPNTCCTNPTTEQDGPYDPDAVCPEPARYAALIDGGRTGDPMEHLVCVQHAAETRALAGDLLLAMKTYRPRDGYGVGLAPAT